MPEILGIGPTEVIVVSIFAIIVCSLRILASITKTPPLK